ncbi:MAG: hypothetical protein AABW50_02090 [Nanoarchaeota archaeon]
MKNKMNTKAILGSFLAVVAVFIMASTVSAVVGDSYDVTWLVNEGANTIEAGETTIVEVWVTAHDDVVDRDVTIEVELDGDDFKVSAETKKFDIFPGDVVKKTLRLEIPRDLDDKLFDDDVTLEITVRGDEYKDIFEDTLSVKRSPYDIAIKSVTADQTVKAGESFPVDIVLKNIGYNDLDDLYVTVSISALGVQKTAYFGDIVALECDNNDENEFPWSKDLNATNDGLGLNRNCDEDDEDTAVGRLVLNIPYDAKAGVYTMEVEVSNDDASSKGAMQIVVENSFDATVYKSGNSIWIVNPTNNVVGYKVIPESPASVSESIVFVPAGASKSVAVEPNANGDYSFDVSVFTLKGELVEKVNFSGSSNTSKTGTTNPVVILTVVLAIIFIVLLVVLIVLLGKKPEKSGEFGESYY